MIELHDQNRELAALYRDRFDTGFPVFEAPVDPEEQAQAIQECLDAGKPWGELHPPPKDGTLI